MTNKILLLILFLISTSKIFSQEIENVDMRVENNIVIITYDLLDVPYKTLCDLSVNIISEKGDIIYPNALTGDVDNVAEGKRKTIRWNVLEDEEELKGRYKASIEVHKKYSTKKTNVKYDYTVFINNNLNRGVKRGENIRLSLSLKNIGTTKATGVEVSIISNNSYVSKLAPTGAIGFYSDKCDCIAAGKVGTPIYGKTFNFNISNTTPKGTTIIFNLSIKDDHGNSISDSFNVIVQ